MAWIDIMSNTDKPELEGFNYATEQDKLKRKRSAAQLLKDQAMQNQQGQFFKHGDFVGYTGGNTLASTAARLVSAYLGSKADKSADAYAADIDKTSDAAFTERTKALDTLLNGTSEKPATDGTSSMAGADQVGQQPVSQPEPAQSYGVPSPQVDMKPLESVTPSPQAAAAAMGAGGGRGFVNEAPGARAAALALPPANGGQRRGGTPAEMRRNAFVAMGGDATPAPAFQGGGATGSWDAPEPTAPVAPSPKIAAQVVAPQQPAPVPQPRPVQPTGLMPSTEPRPMPPQMPQAQPQPVVPAAKQPSQAEVLSQLHSIAKTGPMGQQFASAQLQQLFGPKANGYEFKAVKQGDNEVLVAVNPRTGATQTVWQGSGSVSPEKAAAQRIAAGKDRREEVKLWGEQRRQVAAAQEQAQGAEQAMADFNNALSLAKDVGIQGMFSMGWEKAKNLIKENPKYADLDKLANTETLRFMNEYLKGAPSDREGQRVAATRPQADATVQEWLQWGERALPVLQRAQARAKALHDGELNTARELGIPEYVEAPSAAPTERKTRLDWRQ